MIRCAGHINTNEAFGGKVRTQNNMKPQKWMDNNKICHKYNRFAWNGLM
jgi:hypothetical protein